MTDPNNEVPAVYPVALGGRPYLLDLRPDNGGFTVSSVPVLRNQADQSARPGESSLNPEDLWRRSVESWHHGAAQTHSDRQDSDPYRFRTSLWVDPWTKYTINRLHTLGYTLDANTTRAALVVAGARLFYMNNDSVRYASVIVDGVPTFSASTGLPVGSIYAMATDGQTVYTVHGVNAVYAMPAATAVGASYITNASQELRLVRYCKGRLLAFDTVGKVYNPVVAGALPAALFTQPMGANWVWTDATDGVDNIYMSGYSGTGSEAHGVIYRTATKADGTALDVPIVAMRLPDGEQALSIQGYQGFVFVGTNHGVRACLELDSGALALGSLIETQQACHCFEPQGSQVWFGWDGFDDFNPRVGSFVGLGRMDLSDFVFGDGAPAYASDQMVEDVANRTTLAACTFDDARFFVVGGDGLYGETGQRREEAFLVSGLFNFGITEPKTHYYLQVKTDNGAPVVIPYVDDADAINVDAGLARTNLAISDTSTDDDGAFSAAVFDLRGRRSEQFEYMLRLFQPVNRVTLQARPAVTSRTEVINATLLITEHDTVGDTQRPRNVLDEVQFFRNMMRSGAPTLWQDGMEDAQVVLEDYRHLRISESVENVGSWNGAMQVQMKRHDLVAPVFRSASTVTGNAASAELAFPLSATDSDILFATLAWEAAVATPTPDGDWTLLDSATDTAFRSATWFHVGPPDTLAVTFAGSTKFAGAMVAYTQGTSVVSSDSGNHATSVTPDTLEVIEIINGSPLGAIAATVFAAPTGDTTVVGAFRPRGDEARVTIGGGKDLVVQVGDGLSNSTFMNAAYGAGFIDATECMVAYTGEVRVWMNKLLA